MIIRCVLFSKHIHIHTHHWQELKALVASREYRIGQYETRVRDLESENTRLSECLQQKDTELVKCQRELHLTQQEQLRNTSMSATSPLSPQSPPQLPPPSTEQRESIPTIGEREKEDSDEEEANMDGTVCVFVHFFSSSRIYLIGVYHPALLPVHAMPCQFLPFLTAASVTSQNLVFYVSGCGWLRLS